jgi:hypothetical protein
MIGIEPTWQDLDDLLSRHGLTDRGVATMRWALARLRTLLGDSWLSRQYRKQGRLPGELLVAGTHRYDYHRRCGSFCGSTMRSPSPPSPS